MPEDIQPTTPVKRPWYYGEVFVLVSLLFCIPLGLILMWVGKLWSQTFRIIVTVVLLALLVVFQLMRASLAR